VRQARKSLKGQRRVNTTTGIVEVKLKVVDVLGLYLQPSDRRACAGSEAADCGPL